MKRVLHCRHYGRYVDDFFVVSTDKVWLYSLVPKVKVFLKEHLGLDFHDGKLTVTSVWHGVEFLGAWLKPHRIYVSRNGMGRIKRKLKSLYMESHETWSASLNSYCGLLSHGNNYNNRRRLLQGVENFERYGIFDVALRHYYLYDPCVHNKCIFAAMML